MASIVIDELITKLEYQHDAATVREANQAVQALTEQNKAAAASTDKLSEEQKKLATYTDELTRAQIDFTEQIADTVAETNKLKDEQRELRAAARQAGGATEEQKKRLEELDRQIAANERHTRELREENNRVAIAKRKAAEEARKLSRQQKELAASSRQAASDQRELAEAMRKAEEAAGSQGGMLDGLKERIMGVAGGELAADAIRAIAGAVVELGKEIIVTGANFESLRARLKTVEGSNDAAAQSFSMITEFAKKTPFEVEDITTAFVQLRVRGINPTTEKLTALGDLTSAFGYGFAEMTDAIGAAARGELDPIEKFGIAAKISGDKIRLSFRGQTEEVERSADAVTNVLVKWGQMSGIQGAMAEQSATTAGMFSNLKDTISALFDQIAQMGVLDEVKLIMQELSAAMGQEGLAQVIADVLVMALQTLRELFTSMPQETLIEFLQSIVQLVGQLAGVLVDSATGQASMMSMFLELSTVLLNVISGLFNLLQRLDAIKESLGGVPGPLELLLKGLKLLLLPFDLLARGLQWLLDLLDPFLGKIAELGDRLPSFGDLFAGLADTAKSWASEIGLLNDELSKTASIANYAYDELEKLRKANAYETKTNEELQELVRKGDKGAEAEVRRRRDANEAAELTETLEQSKKDAADELGKRADRLLDNPGRLTRKQLLALAREPFTGMDQKKAQKLRDKAQKELDKRENKATKDGQKAAKKLSDSLLTHQVEKDIAKLAKEAGQREAARALLGGASQDEADARELAQRKAVQARLTKQFEETGRLPPGISQDLVQVSNLPNIEQVGGRLAPPVITVNNTRVEVSGNTFQAMVSVGSSSGTPGEIAQAMLTQSRPVLWEDLGNAILNHTTTMRRG